MTRRGILLGTLDGYYLTDAGETHVALFGETRSGKDTCHILPTISLWDGSMVITDPKHGITLAQTRAYRAQMSDVVVFNPLADVSAGINILDTVYDYRTAHAIAESHLAPEQMVRETATSLHFRELASVLLTAGILHVLETSPRRSMAGVLDFFTLTHDKLDACLAEMIATEHSHPEMHELIVSMAREIEKIKDRELSGVWTTTMRALHLYREPNIARHTDTSDVSLTDLQFGTRPMTLYLVAPSVEDVALYHPVYRVILEMIFRIGTTHPGTPTTLLCSLNEFPAFGYMPRVEVGTATLAEHKIRLFLIAQDLEQFWNVYGRGTQMWGNLHTKIFHGAANDETAKRVSQMLDEQTVEREVVSYHGGWFARRASVSTQQHARRLATPGEVGQWSGDHAIVVISGQRPLNVRKVWWWKDPVFNTRLTDMRGERA